MKSRIRYPACLGVFLTVLALFAIGQTTAGTITQAVVTPNKTATAGATTSAAGISPKAPASNTHT